MSDASTVRLRRVVEFNPSKSAVRSLPNETPVLFLPMEAVSEQGRVLDLGRRKPIGDVYQGYTYFRSGDVLVAKITPCFENGKGALVPPFDGEVGFGTTEFHVLRSSPTLSARYLFYVTASSPFRRLGAAEMKGAAGQQRVPEDFAKDYEIPVLPRPTQEAIADFLDEKTAAIDALIETQQRLLDLLAEKRAALINRAVTRGLDPDAPLKDSGVPWIGEIPAHWEIRRLKSLASFTTSGSRGWAEFYTDDESKPLFLQSGNIGRTLDLDLSTVQHVDPPSGAEGVRTQTVRDDILVCITGARTGAVCLVDRELHVPAYINQHVALVRLRDSIAQSSFIAAALSADPGSHHFQMVQYGGTKQGLGLEDVRDVVLAVPPRAEQASISAVLREATRSIDAAAKEARGAIDRLQEYRQSLITAAVTGQLDIR